MLDIHLLNVLGYVMSKSSTNNALSGEYGNTLPIFSDKRRRNPPMASLIHHFISILVTSFVTQRSLTRAIYLITAAIFMYCGTEATASAGIKGATGITNGGVISGWALDASASSRSVTITIYMDGAIGVGKLQASFTTPLLRGDINSAFKTSGYHGFQWTIPQSQQRSVHIWFVYAASNNSNASVLEYAPAVYPQVSANMIGASQPLDVYNTGACAPDDIPDHPARAFRTADGNVTLLASHVNARRDVGTNLNTIKHLCTIVHSSENDLTFNDFRYWQWLQAPYTLDGKTIYMITHNEWYGSRIKPSCYGDAEDSWVSAITFLLSTNGGASYTRPLDYLVRIPTTPWNNNMPCTPSNPTRYGDLGGSNIVYYSGYYYKFFIYEPEPAVASNVQWQCIMRSNNLASASSWYVWNGVNWTNSKTSSCASVPFVQNIRSVTFNTYLNMYVGIQRIGGNVVFNLSRDLLNWSTPTIISVSGVDLTSVVYPSLLDPTDTTMNFERSGQFPYIYYTQLHNGNWGDLMRFPLKFTVQ